ncbi:hypothetical protein BU16DRAFT_96658 [Lophium mytilinum]|uniref:Uncharacterized protein n=1 Tax=Lophium mytilinum TaxID=390894 RepID=A0A6A6QLR5_9PEZI|nr:hypothetical protein BU16DRAFT_96658 [Lophium mytilinum]
MEHHINAHLLAGRPYITLTPSLSPTSPSFTSPDQPVLSITLQLHNSSEPITVRTIESGLTHPSHCVDLINPDGRGRRPYGGGSGCYRGSRQLSQLRADQFLTLWPQKPLAFATSFRPEGSAPGDPSVPYEEYENPRTLGMGVDLETIKEGLKAAKGEEAEWFLRELRPPGGPYGMDKCVVGQDYVLRVKSGLRVHWWQYGELEELLTEADAIQSVDRRLSIVPEEGSLDILTYDEHREIRFIPID